MPAKRARTSEPVKAPAAKKKVTIQEPAKKPPAKAPAKAAAKAAAKAPAKPAAAKPPAKVAKKASKKDIDHAEFAGALVDVCKVLMGVCETTMDEDSKKFTVATVRDFNAHGAGILKLLPEDARVPMMNMASMYMEELENEPFDFGEGFDDDDDDDDDDEDGGMEATLARNAIKEVDELDEDDDDEDDEDDFLDDLPDTIKEGHFLPFKEYFTKDEAKKLISSSVEGGALYKAMDAAYDSWRKAMEEADDVDEEEDEDGEDDDDLEDDDSELEDEDDMKWAESMPWKGER